MAEIIDDMAGITTAVLSCAYDADPNFIICHLNLPAVQRVFEVNRSLVECSFIVNAKESDGQPDLRLSDSSCYCQAFFTPTMLHTAVVEGLITLDQNLRTF